MVMKMKPMYDSESESEVTQSCSTLCNPVDYSLPVFSIHGILQARILEWVAISFSRGSSRPRDWTQVSHIGGRRFNLWATGETLKWRWNPCICSLKEITSELKIVKVREYKKLFHENKNQKKAEVAILISDKGDFKKEIALKKLKKKKKQRKTLHSGKGI